MKTTIFGALTFFIALLLVSALIVIPASASVPTAPRNLVATKYTGYVTLDWDAPVEGDLGISEYKIYRAESVFSNPLLLEWGYLASTTETIFTHDPLPPIRIPPPTFYNDTNISTSGGISHYYFYKVSAVNDDGEGASSPYGRADPPPDVTPPATITTLATSNPTSSSIQLSWTAPGDDDTTGTASTYDIRYRTDAAITGANWATATQVTGEPDPKSGGSNETFTVTGLEASTTYYFAMKTADEIPNWSPISNSPHGTTADTVNPTIFWNVDLVPGLNLISLPINDSSITTAALLAAKLGPNCSEVIAFNATQQQLQSHVPGVPLNNFAIVGGEGYFVNLNDPTSILLSGTGWPSPFHVSLVSGLNLIGMPVNDTAVTTASTLAAKIGASCQEVVNWESGTQSYVSYVTGVPLNDFAIRAGNGYFVTINNPTTVPFTGTPWQN